MGKKGRILVCLLCLLLLWQGIALGFQLGTRLLRVGDYGNDVAVLQVRLKEVGLDPGPIDGIYGRQTLAAVLQLQKERGIAVDGIVGEETLATLEYVPYAIEAGDTIAAITERFQISEDELIALNGLIANEELKIGQQIFLPLSGKRTFTYGQLPARGQRPKDDALYGELIAWEDVDLLAPIGTELIVTDVETGISFVARRRGGHKHMDMEPLTIEDTQYMSMIYQGEWGWERKAIVVEIDGRLIAASMNGMPHGSGEITNNDFPGHFCVHFLGSRLHNTGRIDSAHQKMIQKAAGN